MAAKCSQVSFVACMAELGGMFLFVIFGCGSAMGLNGDFSGESTSKHPGWVLIVSLTFGLTITVLVYAIGHLSGGHINCAVTFGLVLNGSCGVLQGIANFVCQMIGSIMGALFLWIIYPRKMDQTASMGANGLSDGWPWYGGLLAEVGGTCLLMTVVLQTAVNPASGGNRMLAPLAIGFSVFIAHAILIPIDGCSINPTRSFGPGVVAHFRYSDRKEDPLEEMWIFWVGPILGATLAVGLYKTLNRLLKAENALEANDAKEVAALAAAEENADQVVV